MSDEKKLPMAVQLVGLTAVLVFCLSTIGVFNLVRAFWLSRETIASLQTLNQIELFIPLVLSCIVCVASVATFVALLFRNTRNAALICIMYLVLLLLFWTLHLVSDLLAHSLRPELQPMFAVWLVVRFIYAAWLAGLLVKVWPAYANKRKVAGLSQ
jgi:hypothetical protein